jgi:23S rRNA (cytosine1962-C5)-methyltransferase
MSRNEYALLDSGEGRKLEAFGEYVLDRPCAQAVWQMRAPELWQTAAARFSRKDGLQWFGRDQLPESWHVWVNGVKMRLALTDFGHVGVFPETRSLWDALRELIAKVSSQRKQAVRFLNLFAYSGGATLAAAQAGAQCCHVDAAKGMVEWAGSNAALNGLENASIRWIVDDVNKFLQREARRGRVYDLVLLDPPSFGRGKQGELYKIEQDLWTTLTNVKAVLSAQPVAVFLTSHTPGFTPVLLQNLLRIFFAGAEFKAGELLLEGEPSVLPLPSGTWAHADFSRFLYPTQ